jgi:hypothetical protein
LNIGMFASGNTPGGSDLLGNSNAVFLGNGFGNIDSTNTAAVSALVNSTGTSFDLTDFPSLAGGIGGANASVAGNGLAAALRQQQQQQQQQLLAHQQMLQSKGGVSNASNLYRLAMSGANGNFNMATEDFPALGANAPQPAPSGSSALNPSSLLSGSMPVSRGGNANGNVGGLYADIDTNKNNTASSGSQLDLSGGLLGGTGLGGLGGIRGLQQAGMTGAGNAMGRAPSSTVPGAGAIGSSSSGGAAAGGALTGDYGLLGLLGVIRMTDDDRNTLALGSDLTMLGLNLGSTEQIYSTFSSPWSDNVATKEPHYQLPVCYYMQPPALKTGHLSKFQLETLFYIFYALPKDVLQAYAAQELYSREWRYHGELKLWFKRASPSDGVSSSSSGSPQYLYFDINSWERRLFNGSMNQNITSGFITEDEVQVKFPSS